MKTLCVLVIAWASVAPAASMPVCSGGHRVNCVVDGDTFWWRGKKYRIADIDAPETDASCEAERRLAAEATSKLKDLLANDFAVEPTGRFDRYGRRLVIVKIDNKSVGETLIAAGLARRWQGRKEHWCPAP